MDKLFKEVDKDGNDELSNDEIGQLCMMFGQTVSEEEINQAIKKADTDGDGTVNVDEFKAEILSSLVCSLKKYYKKSHKSYTLWSVNDRVVAKDPQEIPHGGFSCGVLV